MPALGDSAESATIYCDDSYDQRVMIRVKSIGGGEYMLVASDGEYMLVASDGNIGLYDVGSSLWVGQLSW